MSAVMQLYYCSQHDELSGFYWLLRKNLKVKSYHILFIFQFMLKSSSFRKLSIFKRTPTSFKNIICVFVIMYCTYPLYRSLKLCFHRLIVFIVFTLLLHFEVNDSKYQNILPAQIFVNSPSWQLINSRSKCFTRQKLTTFRTSHISSKLDN